MRESGEINGDENISLSLRVVMWNIMYVCYYDYCNGREHGECGKQHYARTCSMGSNARAFNDVELVYEHLLPISACTKQILNDKGNALGELRHAGVLDNGVYSFHSEMQFET